MATPRSGPQAPETEEGMYAAVHALVDMLDGHEDTGDDEVKTKEIIGKIMGIVHEMVDAEKTGDSPSAGASSPLTSASVVSRSNASPRRGTPSKSKYKTELPHYPTPYELWQKSHEKSRAATPKEKVAALSKQERKDKAKLCTDRLLRKQREEHFTMMKKQHKKLANELRGLTFVPDLSETQSMNKKYVQEYEPLYKRYNYVTEMANIKRTKMEQQTRTAELTECSFKPDISATSTKMSPQIGSKVWDRCIKFGLEKDMWAQQRKEIINRIEAQSLTFAPTISAKTANICDRLRDEGKYFTPGSNKKSIKGIKNPNAGHEQDTFHPKISLRSRNMVRTEKTYERLYRIAQEKEKARREFEGKYLDEFVTGVAKPQSARKDDFPDRFAGMSLSGVERSELRERMMAQGVNSPHLERLMPQGANSPQLVAAENYVNVVAWDSKYSFIAAQFPDMSN